MSQVFGRCQVVFAGTTGSLGITSLAPPSAAVRTFWWTEVSMGLIAPSEVEYDALFAEWTLSDAAATLLPMDSSMLAAAYRSPLAVNTATLFVRVSTGGEYSTTLPGGSVDSSPFAVPAKRWGEACLRHRRAVHVGPGGRWPSPPDHDHRRGGCRGRPEGPCLQRVQLGCVGRPLVVPSACFSRARACSTSDRAVAEPSRVVPEGG